MTNPQVSGDQNWLAIYNWFRFEVWLASIRAILDDAVSQQTALHLDKEIGG